MGEELSDEDLSKCILVKDDKANLLLELRADFLNPPTNKKRLKQTFNLQVWSYSDMQTSVWSSRNPPVTPHLLLQEEGHAVTHLVSVDGGQRDVEEKAVQHWFGDPLQRDGKQQQRHTDEDVCSQRCEAGFLYLYDTEERQTQEGGHVCHETWQIYLNCFTVNSLVLPSRLSFGKHQI